MHRYCLHIKQENRTECSREKLKQSIDPITLASHLLSIFTLLHRTQTSNNHQLWPESHQLINQYSVVPMLSLFIGGCLSKYFWQQFREALFLLQYDPKNELYKDVKKSSAGVWILLAALEQNSLGSNMSQHLNRQLF